MHWPSDQDYNEAVQNPISAFDDPELQSGLVESYATGIPKARSGNFASVYKVIVNGTPYAVKCFRYDNPEYSRRYPAIASHLNQNRLPYFVYFRYMSRGIRVGGVWYPVLKMKWVDGESLISFVERNLNSPATLRRLAVSWTHMLADLQATKIAHGDLQHGNVLVVGGEIKLVDYDGMYVPGLAGSRGLETGHRNYQHPERTELDFGLYLDNFSAWLIYISLVALSFRPTLWQQLRSGDECLLFRQQDLVAPDQSEAFRLLKSVPDEHTRDLVERVEEFLWLPPSRIPSVTEEPGASVSDASPSASPRLADWITDHIQTRSSQSSSDPEEIAASEIGDPSWIQDHVVTPIGGGSFQNSVKFDRLVALGVCSLATVICAWLSSGAAFAVTAASWFVGTVLAGGLSLLWWFSRYRHEPISLTIGVDPIFETAS